LSAIFRLNPSSGIPLYLQLMEQVKHAVETGALREGEQLPTIRKLAEDLVMNPNTVARAYRELESEGVIEVRHGSGAFIKGVEANRAGLIQKGQSVMKATLERLISLGLTDDEIRRVIENGLAQGQGQRRPAPGKRTG
jgi:GntR family transcriptional regulator